MKIDKEELFFRILIVLLLILIIIGTISSCLHPVYYICTDEQGNEITCIDIDNEKGTYWGILEDGTHIKITSYKRVEE